MTRSVFSVVFALSKSIILYLLIIHSLMLVTLLSLVAFSWWSLLIIVIMVLSFSYFYKQTQCLIKLQRDADNNWCCHYKNGRLQEKLRLTNSIVNVTFVMLYFEGRASAIIMADAVDAELFRQLRVYCRDPKTFQK
ncbi:MAG: hypothetical protein HRT92_05495 [Piscirickettsiaceae bacterium]|nr:hypothetical protein [Piscirickettsiaceae bacterium]